MGRHMSGANGKVGEMPVVVRTMIDAWGNEA
jgi:hypothetical protein